MRRGLLLTAALLAFAAFRPALAAEPAPGDACGVAGNFLRSAGPEVTGGGHFLVCDGANWVSVLDYRDGGTTLTQVGNDAGLCTAAKDGRIRYVSSGDPPFEYCDGGATAWRPFKQPRCTDDDTGECYLDATRSNDDPDFKPQNIADGVNILGVTGTLSGGAGCAAPASCSNVGDVCTDGSLFAGFISANDGSCRAIFVTDDNQSLSSQWKTATGTDDITDPADEEDAVDGQYNRDNRGGGTFPAFEFCENNTYHGKNDWYLPARAELNLLWLNRAAIDANAAGNFTTSGYWSSTEYGTNLHAWVQVFGDGAQTSYYGKTDSNLDVRCIRSEDATSSGGGSGCTAPTSCPNVGDVCTDGSQFAGFMVYNGSCEPLYVTDNNQSTSSQWKTATGTNDITDPADKNDAVDGQYNRDNRGAGTFPAFELCEDNTYHGKNDWYLPARAELNLLWLNQAAIDANAAGNFTTSVYWSSTELDTNYAWNQHFGNGFQNYYNKTEYDDVRCVRRD